MYRVIDMVWTRCWECHQYYETEKKVLAWRCPYCAIGIQQRHSESVNKLYRRIAGLRGVITKLKRKIKHV